MQDLIIFPKQRHKANGLHFPTAATYSFSREGEWGRGRRGEEQQGLAGLEVRACHTAVRWFAEEITPSREASAYAVTNRLKGSSPFFVQQQISRLG